MTPPDFEHTSINPIVWECLKSQGIDERIVDAMKRTPIQKFLSEQSRFRQPPNSLNSPNKLPRFYHPARALQALQAQPKSRILEIGTFLGCNAAVLSELEAIVYTVEIDENLAATARELLHRFGYGSVSVINANGLFGLPQFALYDRIIFTCSMTQRIPLVEKQLVAGGRIVYALQHQFEQRLISIDKDLSGKMLSPVDHGPTAFEPIRGNESAT
ncbi:protein-L-isoaspartate O-methyltransferase family protein [Prosthecobacter vanneervenii]|uniref:Protein-L-isoaspartate O-methyltransferase n=1 Tax=Prosthecobacter vanneervenii TaxID=48466 RepID=A0A7W7YC04_9BACT|nr:hypothetical protein [Prosthecobacter vanneervenii]MBB5033406.1 protein-L-isoaspartate(D-aspartate) O-methyltransferase [Prosthecobacter vanneervenii]